MPASPPPPQHRHRDRNNHDNLNGFTNLPPLQPHNYAINCPIQMLSHSTRWLEINMYLSSFQLICSVVIVVRYLHVMLVKWHCTSNWLMIFLVDNHDNVSTIGKWCCITQWHISIPCSPLPGPFLKSVHEFIHYRRWQQQRKKSTLLINVPVQVYVDPEDQYFHAENTLSTLVDMLYSSTL